jgi:hypothetical protein
LLYLQAQRRDRDGSPDDLDAHLDVARRLQDALVGPARAATMT